MYLVPVSGSEAPVLCLLLTPKHISCFSLYWYSNNARLSANSQGFSCQGGAPAHISSASTTRPPLLDDYSTQVAPRRPPLSLSAHSPPDSQNQLVWPSFFFFFFFYCLLTAVCAAVAAWWCQPPPKREEEEGISLPLLCFQCAFTFLLAGSFGFRAVPVNSPPFSQPRVEQQQQLGNIWPPQSARPSACSPRLGCLLWKLVQSQSSFVSGGKNEGGFDEGRRWTVLSVSLNTGVRLKEAQEGRGWVKKWLNLP